MRTLLALSALTVFALACSASPGSSAGAETEGDDDVSSIATGYGATAEDVATGLATHRLWTLDVEGGDFRRLVSLSSEVSASSPGASLFVYSARSYEDDGQSPYASVVAERRVVKRIPGSAGVDVMGAAFAPDDAHLVYCQRTGTTRDSQVADLGVDPRRLPNSRATAPAAIRCSEPMPTACAGPPPRSGSGRDAVRDLPAR